MDQRFSELDTVCCSSTRIEHTALSPKGGEGFINEIDPNGKTNNYNFYFYPASLLSFYADTPGRYVLSFVLAGKPSNQVTIDVVGTYKAPRYYNLPSYYSGFYPYYWDYYPDYWDYYPYYWNYYPYYGDHHQDDRDHHQDDGDHQQDDRDYQQDGGNSPDDGHPPDGGSPPAGGDDYQDDEDDHQDGNLGPGHNPEENPGFIWVTFKKISNQNAQKAKKVKAEAPGIERNINLSNKKDSR